MGMHDNRREDTGQEWGYTEGDNMKIIKEEESFELFAEKMWGKVLDVREYINDSTERFEAMEDILAETLGNFSDHDTLVHENELMARFIKSQGFNVDDVIFFNGNLEKVLFERFNK